MSTVQASMHLTRDVGIGFLNSLWSAGVGFAAVPVYVHYLGIEAYGLIGFFASTQALLQLLEMGLSPTINRQVARFAAGGHLSSAANLVHSISFVYWGIALAIGIFMYLLAGPIAEQWLQSRHLSQATIERSVFLLGLVIACRWPIGLYQGVLMGALRLNVSSGINMLMVSLASGGAILVLAFVSATPEAFFAWQALAGLAYALTMRHAAWRVLRPIKKPRFDASELARIGSIAVGMSGVALSGVVLSQMDKVILSRLLPLDDFGRYAIAAVVASGLYLVLTPTFNIIYPRLSAYAMQSTGDELVDFYRTGSRLLSAVLFPIAATAAFFSYELLVMWTRNPQLAEASATVTSFYLLGTALNGAMHFPYALQLAFGTTRLPMTINVILLSVMVPLTIFLAMRLGALGGAMAWAILNVVYFIFGTWLTHRTLMRGQALKWSLTDIAAPGLLTTATVGLSSVEIRSLGLEPGTTLLAGCAVAAVCAAVLLSASRCTRLALRSLRPGQRR